MRYILGFFVDEVSAYNIFEAYIQASECYRIM